MPCRKYARRQKRVRRERRVQERDGKWDEGKKRWASRFCHASLNPSVLHLSIYHIFFNVLYWIRWGICIEVIIYEGIQFKNIFSFRDLRMLEGWGLGRGGYVGEKLIFELRRYVLPMCHRALLNCHGNTRTLHVILKWSRKPKENILLQ